MKSAFSLHNKKQKEKTKQVRRKTLQLLAIKETSVLNCF